MSDYESDSSVIVPKPTPTRRQKKSHGSTKNTGLKTRFDYESDSSEVVPKSTSTQRQKKSAVKRRVSEAAAGSTKNTGLKASKKSRATDLFQLEEDVEAQHPTAKKTSELGSSIISKVANGKVRRSADLLGEFYVDLKIYHKANIVSTPPEERWKKAAVTLKAQLDQESPQWEYLQKFMKRAHDLFINSEPTFYSDKVNFK